MSINIKNFKMEKIEVSNIEKYIDGSLTIIIMGNLYDNNRMRMNAGDIARLYRKCDQDIYEHFDGSYTVAIIDEVKKTVDVYQDYFGSGQYVYIYSHEDSIIISNNLKMIVNSHYQKWELNESAAAKFLRCGYCTGSETLIKQISKIPCRRYLHVDALTRKVVYHKYKRDKKYKGKTSFRIYDNMFEKICNMCVEPGTVMTLSKGYDSNFIMHQLQKRHPEHIESYCIGGMIGANEIPAAKFISEYYGNVSVKTGYVSENALQNLPEIMYALDFSIYECGVFLQYELGKLLSKNGKTKIIVGECADQVLNFYTYHQFVQRLYKTYYYAKCILKNSWRHRHFGPFRPPYDMGAYVIIKKSGILSNYYGINPEYPYVSKEYIRFAKRVVRMGKQNKRYHKKAIAELLPKEIADTLIKMPGTTDRQGLVAGNISLDDIKLICKYSKYNKNYKYEQDNHEIDYYLKVLCLELFKIMYIYHPDKYLVEPYCGLKLQDYIDEIKNKTINEHGESRI